MGALKLSGMLSQSRVEGDVSQDAVARGEALGPEGEGGASPQPVSCLGAPCKASTVM